MLYNNSTFKYIQLKWEFGYMFYIRFGNSTFVTFILAVGIVS